jgi:glycosyltransferase involved in cell wall biosynthesis
VCERLLGLTGRRPSLILPPMIDTALFRNEGVPRDIANLFVGVIGEAKGLDEMRRRYGGSDITLIGRVAPGARLDFGRHVPHVPYQDVPRWMNRARNFVFLPRWPEPQGRVVAEAALCGCSIVGNDHVGALSFGFDLADPANYTGAEQLFWQGVEGLA